MKKMSIILLTVIMLFSGLGMTGCSQGENINKDPKTLNVRIYKAGYGDEHYRAVFSQFEQMYTAEGYKINIVSSNSLLQGGAITNELALRDKNGIDLYFAGAINSAMLVNSSITEKFILAEDLTDLYNTKPIQSKLNLDGTISVVEENGATIMERLKPGFETIVKYDGTEQPYQNKAYTFPLYSSPGGFIVNTKVLDAYDIEIPLTSNQLINAFSAIKNNPNPGNGLSGIKPVSWAGLNAITYWYMVEDVWAAQYDTLEKYQQFVSMSGFSDIKEAYKVYENNGWLYSLTAMETMLNLDNTTDGAIIMDHGQMQFNFLNDKTAFMPNGAWLQKEMSVNYSSQLQNTKMIATPIISALGVKLRLDGSITPAAVNEDLCDEILAAIVKLVDEEKTIAEIKTALGISHSSLSFSDEQIQAVIDARGIYDDWGMQEEAVMSSTSKKKDIAKLLLRFIASTEGARYYYNFASAITPYQTSIKYNEENATTPFLQSVIDLISRENSKYLHRWSSASALRMKTNLACFPEYSLPEKDIATGVSGATIWTNSKNRVTASYWETLLRNAKLID